MSVHFSSFSGDAVSLAASGPVNSRRLVFGNNQEPDAVWITPSQKKRYLDLAYQDTQDFRARFRQVIHQAKTHMAAWLKTHPADETAVVLDLDETILDNSTFYMLHPIAPEITPNEKPYHTWVKKSDCAAIDESLELIQFLMEEGVQIDIVTNRSERLREATLRNLDRIGLPRDKYNLHMKPDGYQSPGKGNRHNRYKVDVQSRIQSEGRKKIAMVMGNAPSDVANALGEPFLLPDVNARPRRDGWENKSIPLTETQAGKIKKAARMHTQAFQQELQSMLDEEKRALEVWLENHEASKSALVVDIDETLLNNASFLLESQVAPPDSPAILPYPDWQPFHIW